MNRRWKKINQIERRQQWLLGETQHKNHWDPRGLGKNITYEEEGVKDIIVEKFPE